MIITLIKADFSANNIGTLSSFNVLTNLGGGLTYNGPITIERNGTLSAYIDVAQNATVQKAVLYMAGVVVQNLEVVNGVISINIPNVTGHIVIEVDTDVQVIVPVEPIYYKMDTPAGSYLKDGAVQQTANSGMTDYINISHMPKIGWYGRMGSPVGYNAIEFYDADKKYLSHLSVNGIGTPTVVNIDLSADQKYRAATYVRASYAAGTYTDIMNKFYFVINDFATENGKPEEEVPVTGIQAMFPINEYPALDGTFVSANGGNAYRTDFMPIEGKTTMTYIGRMGTIGLNYVFYDADKNMISGLEKVGNGSTISESIDLTDAKYANATYVIASVSKGSISDAEWNTSFFELS